MHLYAFVIPLDVQLGRWGLILHWMRLHTCSRYCQYAPLALMKPQAAVLLERLMGLVAGSPREILLLVLDAILSTLAVGSRAANLRRNTD